MNIGIVQKAKISCPFYTNIQYSPFIKLCHEHCQINMKNVDILTTDVSVLVRMIQEFYNIQWKVVLCIHPHKYVLIVYSLLAHRIILYVWLNSVLFVSRYTEKLVIIKEVPKFFLVVKQCHGHHVVAC